MLNKILIFVFYVCIISALIACGKAEPELILNVTGDGDMLIDETHFYWTDKESGYVAQLDLQTNTITYLAQNQSSPHYMAMDSEFIYWYDTETRKIQRIHKNGGEIEIIIHYDGEDPIRKIYVDDKNVYWIRSFVKEGVSFTAKDGSGQPQAIMVPESVDMISTEDSLYVLTLSGLKHVDMSTLEVTHIADAQGQFLHDKFTYMVIDNTMLYVVSDIDYDVIYRYRIDDFLSEDIFFRYEESQFESLSIAQDSEYIYAITNLTGDIIRLSKEDGTTSLIYEALATTNIEYNLVVNSEWLFWRNRSGSSSNYDIIMKMRKP